jgi:outer membrane protein assembly factor BamB
MIRTLLMALVALVFVGATVADDWPQFRGPGGQGVAAARGLPVVWDARTNIAWKTELPGAGASSPVVVGDRVFVTCYSGYGLSKDNAGDMKQLKRHLVCLDRVGGKILWTRDIVSVLPETKYDGYNALHGFASSTPASDGKHVFVLFGKTGVFCFDLDGKQVWHASVGKGGDGFGAGPSPIVYGDLLIVNASMESRSLVALNKSDGKEVWSVKIGRTWCTPIVVTVAGRAELVLSMPESLLGLDPLSGAELWRCKVIRQTNYVCPSPVAHDGVVYAGFHNGFVAVRAGGKGDVTATHLLWSINRGTNVSSPLYHDGHVYFATDAAAVQCVTADKGAKVYQQRLDSRDRIYGSPLLAEGKLYYVTREEGVFVLEAGPRWKVLAHNVIADDPSVCNGSLAVTGSQLLLRSDRYLYCIGKNN